MADTPSTLRLEGEYVPETHRTLQPDHTISEDTLPGMYNVYLVGDDFRILFTQYKAGKIADAIALAKASQPSQPSQPVEQPEQV